MRSTRRPSPFPAAFMRIRVATNRSSRSVVTRSFALGSLVMGLTLVPTASADTPGQVDFNFQIRPLLSDRCFKCHGPDESQREADLRLDIAEGIFAELNSDRSTHIVRPGETQYSELFRRIVSRDPDVRMPPQDSKLSLTAEETLLIRHWIEQGAPWKDHWSFLPVRSVEVPSVSKRQWPRNEIDYFILDRLDRENLEPSPEAIREKLIRRLSFDLGGLPPTIEEIEAFVSDPAPDAYERLVDRILDSRRYGERMASIWLDIARYSDTYGYQVDRDRYVWPWRDWVIKAFNENMPYDQFITWQLAGDLLPAATDEQVLATTFNRLHPQKVEGGSVPEEFRVEYVADRNQTVATAFLGLTLECARCHDHKYDPITQREYYQLFSFFDNIDEAGLYSYFTSAVPTPTLLLAKDTTKAKMAEIEDRLDGTERRLRSLEKQHDERFEKWLSKQSLIWAHRSPPQVTGDAVLGEHKSSSRTTAEPKALPSAANIELVPGKVAHLTFDENAFPPNETVSGGLGNAVRLTGDDGIGLKVGNFRRFVPFSVAFWMQTPDHKDRAVVFHRSRAWTDAGSRGYQMLIEDGCLSASLIHFWPGNAIRIRTAKPIPTSTWLHVAATYDGSSRAHGLQIYIDGMPTASTLVRDHLYKNITGGGGDSITIGQRFRDRGFTGGLVDEFQVFKRCLTQIEVAQLHDGSTLIDALRTPTVRQSEKQREQLLAYYRETADPHYQESLASLKAIREELCQTADGIPEIMVMREGPKPRQTYVLQRGAYDKPLAPVESMTPSVFPAFPSSQPRNRLGLARWLTASEHPLTARVIVNRLWQMCFGRGLVATPEDFGRQGALPSHPRLLDWLAGNFMKHDWDVKWLLKKMVMSATYRQTSVVTNEHLARDPENRLLARSPSYRLPAEMLRDNALSVGNLLIDRIGGPPAKPYEVAVSFKPIEHDKGEGLYRRSIYTYWKRTAPAPVMMTLDASKRDVCRMRRERTASPLQALVVMNGPEFVEAARGLATRLIHRHKDNPDALIKDMFRVLTSRRASENEIRILCELYEEQLATFQRKPEQAKEYLSVGETAFDSKIPMAQLAAASFVANTLMNHDECVMKR